VSGCAQDAAAAAATEPPAVPREQLRLRCVDRERVVPIPARLEELLPADHLARLIWDATVRLDLAAFYAPIVVVEVGRGKPPLIPRFWWRSGSTPPVRVSRAPVPSTTCASNIWPTSGCAVASL